MFYAVFMLTTYGERLSVVFPGAPPERPRRSIKTRFLHTRKCARPKRGRWKRRHRHGCLVPWDAVGDRRRALARDNRYKRLKNHLRPIASTPVVRFIGRRRVRRGARGSTRASAGIYRAVDSLARRWFVPVPFRRANDESKYRRYRIEKKKRVKNNERKNANILETPWPTHGGNGIIITLRRILTTRVYCEYFTTRVRFVRTSIIVVSNNPIENEINMRKNCNRNEIKSTTSFHIIVD